jgi:DNA-binding transcriptional LysR family regulator
LNVHHLELFYYVARHGGISRAVRKMPYGIQQPAVSSQIRLLEQDLGVRLFERGPFHLTAEGEEVYAYVRPFFEKLDTLGARMRQRGAPLLRIGAAEFVLREHLAAVVRRLRRLQPGIRLGFRSGYDYELEAWLQDRQIDVAVTAVDHRLPAGLHGLPLLQVPLVLLVPRHSRYHSAREVWRQAVVEDPLISLPDFEPITRIFQRGLQRLKVDWPIAIEASSMDLVAWYVANGYGLGVSVPVVPLGRRAAVRALPLDGFAPLVIAGMWFGEATPMIEAILEESRRYVQETWPEWQCGGREGAIPDVGLTSVARR